MESGSTAEINHLVAGIQAPAAHNDVYESIRQLLDLPPDFLLVADMECVHRRNFKLSNSHGHLYIFNKCVAFYSKEIKTPIILHYDKIKSVQKSARIADRIKGKIKIFLNDGTKVGFKRLKNRDQTYDQIIGLMASFGKLPKESILTSSVLSSPQDSLLKPAVIEEEETKKGSSKESSEEDDNPIQEEEEKHQ